MGGMVKDSSGWGTVGWSLGIVVFVSGIPTILYTGGPLNRSFKIPCRGKRDGVSVENNSL